MLLMSIDLHYDAKWKTIECEWTSCDDKFSIQTKGACENNNNQRLIMRCTRVRALFPRRLIELNFDFIIFKTSFTIEMGNKKSSAGVYAIESIALIRTIFLCTFFIFREWFSVYLFSHQTLSVTDTLRFSFVHAFLTFNVKIVWGHWYVRLKVHKLIKQC